MFFYGLDNLILMHDYVVIIYKVTMISYNSVYLDRFILYENITIST